jgi:hypothetical protein
MVTNLEAVFPARNPIFSAMCYNCKFDVESPLLFTSEDNPHQYVCVRCTFRYFKNSHDVLNNLMMARDTKELQRYGSYAWR